MKITIYRMVHAETGEVFEGDGHECAAHVGRNVSRISQALRNRIKVADFWSVTKVTDEAVIMAHARRLGYERKCVICGKTYMATVKTQKCCSRECTRESGRIQSAEWWDKKYESVPVRKPTKKSPASEIAEAGRAEGLSYGKYVAATEYPVKIVRKW